MSSFDKYLEECLGVFQYNTDKIMSTWDLHTKDDIPEENYQKPVLREPPEQTLLNQYTMMTEIGKKYIMEENNLLNTDIIFPKGGN